MALTEKALFQAPDRINAQLLPIKALRSGFDKGDGRTYELDKKLLGQSEIMRALKHSIRSVARSEETVLITGESGRKGINRSRYS